MSIVSTKQAGLAGFTKYRSLDVASGSPVFYGTKGMILMKPTSITHSGTSASLGANGQVTFTAVTSLSLNGVFSADFDNYAIWMRHVNATLSPGTKLRLRVAGTDETGSNYTFQYVYADGSTVAAARSSSQTSTEVGSSSLTQRSGDTAYVYGPFLAQPTAFRNTSASGYNSAYIFDLASTHSLSTSYDGFTVFPNTSSITGELAVYGIRS